MNASTHTVPLIDFLTTAARLARTGAWVSAKQAADLGVESTATVAFHTAQAGGEIADEDRETVTKAIAWQRAKSDHDYASDFDAHILRLIDHGSGMVHAKSYPQLGSMIGSYTRAMAREAEIAQAPTGSFLGEVGERVAFTATVERVTAMTGRFPSFAMAMTTTDGRRVSWIASRRMDVGETVTLRGTVKAHREFRGQLETQVTRCTKVAASAAA